MPTNQPLAGILFRHRACEYPHNSKADDTIGLRRTDLIAELRLPVSPKALLEKLIRFDSVNPSLDAAGGGEREIGEYITEFCRGENIDCRFQDVEGDRRNVLASVPGSSDERLLFVAHLDTVPAQGWQRNPFESILAGSRLYGRGSCDTKASLAVMLAALQSIAREKPRATIVVAGSVDEEYRKKGARALGTIVPRFDGAIVGEPTDLEMVVSHKGSVRWKIETTGLAAHTSIPENGVNAIESMAQVVLALKTLNEDLAKRVTPLTGPPTLTVSLVEGGTDICTVPARCVISVDRRLVPGESPKAAVEEVERILDGMRFQNPNLRVQSVLPTTDDFPVSGALSTRLAEVTQQACQKIAGTGEPRGVPYGTDASELSAAGIPCIIIGPGSIEQAHTVDEYVEVAQLEKAFEIYRSIMLTY
jgi:acetylornithine deacetylase/succinyl-diaminopimelate desuccinylase family protein